MVTIIMIFATINDTDTINIKLPINSVIIIEIIHEYRGYWHWYIRMWAIQ